MKATKKIVGATAALVAAVALSAGSTFAWFTTANSNVKVSEIDVTVTTKGGDLSIALVDADGNAGAYAYSLTAPEYVGEFDAVTTSDGVKFYSATYIEEAGETNPGTVHYTQTRVWDDATGAYSYTDATPEAVTQNDTDQQISGKYYQITVSLLATSDMDVYLNTDTTLTDVTDYDTFAKPSSAYIKSWDTFAAGTYGQALSKNATIETSAVNAARVSFNNWAMTYGTDNSIATKTAATAAQYYWAPNDSADATSGNGFYAGNLAKDYLTYKYNGSVATPASAYYIPATGTAIAPLATANSVGDGSTKLVSLKANQEQYVTISFWLEGEDGDCLNSIFGQSMQLVLSFYGKDTATGSTGTDVNP